MTNFDAIFDRLHGLSWSHAVMAAACFVLGCALSIAPLWDYADTMSTLRLLSWFGIGAGALSVIGAFASTAPFTLRGAEPAVGALLLVSGLWTLNFPAAAGALKISLFATCAFMALYILVTAVAMECRGVGRWMVQVAVAVAVLLAAFAGLFGLFGTAGMLPAFALALYVAAWGFVYAAVSLSVSGGVEGARG